RHSAFSARLAEAIRPNYRGTNRTRRVLSRRRRMKSAFRLAAAGYVLPFRLGQQSIGFACHPGEPGHILLNVDPGHFSHWRSAARKGHGILFASRMPVAGAPLAPSDLELADSERLTDGHLPLWTLVASAPGLARNLWRRRVLRLSTMKSRSVL